MNYKLVDNIEEYIDDIITLDDNFYDQAYLWDNDYQRKVYDRNHDSFIAVSLDNKLVGYINYLSITTLCNPLGWSTFRCNFSAISSANC